MSNQFSESSVVKDIADLTYTMWEKGWDESNGGNVSYILSPDQINDLDIEKIKEIKVDAPNMPINMIDKYILITASGSQFRTLKHNLKRDVGVIKITKKGYSIVWGFEDNRKPTSEFYMHVLSHSARLDVDPSHKVVVHNHASNAVAHSLIVPPNDKDYTLPLWKVLTESIVVFPDGVGVLPWQVPGTEEIGKATAEKLNKCRIVVWTFHGVLATGTSFQDCFGLIETIDKAARIYRETLTFKKHDGLTEENILEVCEKLNIVPRQGILSE